MAPHSGTLAWKIPWMEVPGGLPSLGSHRVRHDWSDLAVAVFSSISYLYVLEINPLLVASLADIFSYLDFGNKNQILAAADTYEQTFISQKVTPFDTSSLPGILGCRPGWWWWPHESAGTSCGRDTLDSTSEWQWLPTLLLRRWR